MTAESEVTAWWCQRKNTFDITVKVCKAARRLPFSTPVVCPRIGL